MDKSELFTKLLKDKPAQGSILVSFDGEPVPIFVDTKPDVGHGPKRVMFANALIDEDVTGWYLMKSERGLKCLILPKSQEELIRLNGGSVENLTVTKLRVVRCNNHRTALICEIA